MTLMKMKEPVIVAPPVNIRVTEKEAILEADMPGLAKEAIELELKGDELTITGKRVEEELPGGYSALLKERRPLEYRRKFELNGIQSDKLTARYENGVLTVILPKSERLQPKKIAVT